MYRKSILVALSLMIIISGCYAASSQNGEHTPRELVKGSRIVYGLIGDPVILNPILQTNSTSGLINNHIFSGLVQVGPNLEMVPNLAEKWEFSEDGLIWTFHLRKNVLWHDGTPFTSADVKYTYDAIQHGDYLGIRATAFEPITKIVTPDEYTVVLYLSTPHAPLLSKLTVGIIPKHLYETTEIGKMRENPACINPIGTGPYKFVEMQEGQHIILEAFQDYYGQGPYIETVTVRFFKDDQLMLSALENGDIDYMGLIPPDQIERMKANHSDRLDFREVPRNGYNYIGLKQTHPILRDKKVRKALAYSFNRHQVIDEIFKGYATVMNANIHPISWAYAGNRLNDYSYDPDKAGRLLEEAGWTEIGEDGIRIKDGKRLSFNLLSTTGNKNLEATLLAAQEQWKRVGIEVNIELFDWSVLCQQYLDKSQFESYALGWSLELDPDCYLFFHSSAAVNEKGQLVGFNDVEFKNTKLDRFLEQGRTEMSKSKRKEIYTQIQEILNEELPYIFLYSDIGVAAMDKRVRGVTWSTLGPIFPETFWIQETDID